MRKLNLVLSILKALAFGFTISVSVFMLLLAREFVTYNWLGLWGSLVIPVIIMWVLISCITFILIGPNVVYVKSEKGTEDNPDRYFTYPEKSFKEPVNKDDKYFVVPKDL